MTLGLYALIVVTVAACEFGDSSGTDTTSPSDVDAGNNTDAGTPKIDADIPASDAASTSDAASSVDSSQTACQVRPACNAALPDLGPARGFRNLSSKVTVKLGAERHRGRDIFMRPGDPAWALGKFAYGPLDDDIKGEDVDVYLLRDCGTEWTKIGTYETTKDGAHAPVFGVEDTGGRIYANLGEKGIAPLGIGRHRVLMVVAGDLTTTSSYIEVLPSDAKIVVSDVDGTLTTSEYASATDVLGLPPADAHPGAADMMNAFAARGYYIFYLTARPEWMTHFSRDWFPLRGFPPGLLHTTLMFQGANGASAAKYKADELAALKATVGITPSYGFGNKDSDVTAYTGATLDPKACFYFGLGSDLKGGTKHSDYRMLVSFASSTPRSNCR
jgi:hypothetical protein